MAVRSPAAWPLPELLLLLVAAVWGASYSAVKYATAHLPVLEFLALRFALTLVLLLPALAPLWRTGGRRQAGVGALLGLNLLAVFLCETFGVTLTSAANAAFLISLCVAFTPLVQWWLLGEAPPRSVLVACAASLVGAALLAWQPGQGLLGSLGRGELLMVLAALLRALMVCLTRRLNQHQPVPALTLTALQAAMIAAGSGGLAWALPGAPVAWPEASSFWWAMAFLVLCCTVFAFFAQNYAASRASPSRVALLMASEPVFGALVALWWLGEGPAPLGWLGGALIVGSALYILRPQR